MCSMCHLDAISIDYFIILKVNILYTFINYQVDRNCTEKQPSNH